MKTITKTFKNAIIACLFLATAITFAQTTVNNNPNTAADFTDLQAAIDAATNGDVLYVQQSSTIYGSITINKELTIIGRSSSDTGYRTQVQTMSFAAGSSNTTIKGLEIVTVNSINDDASLIENLVFNDNKITSQLVLQGSHPFNNVLIQGNTFGASGVVIGANNSNVLITKVMLRDNVDFIIFM